MVGRLIWCFWVASPQQGEPQRRMRLINGPTVSAHSVVPSSKKRMKNSRASSSSIWLRSAATFASEGLIQIVEHRNAAFEPLPVVLAEHRDTLDQPSDPAGLIPPKLAVFQVDIVDDLTDRRERRVGQAQPGQQHLERAAVALVGELGLEHVEPYFVRLRHIAFGRDELEPGLRIDEAS